MLVHVGGRGEEKEWREGDFGGLSGREVIESIAHGRMWLNLLRVHEIDRRYGDLLDSIFDEIQGHVPGYRTFNRINGILISSPAAQVYYISIRRGRAYGRSRAESGFTCIPPRRPS